MSVRVETRASAPAAEPAPQTSTSPANGRSRVSAFITLGKPGITRMILVSTAAGFFLASKGAVDFLLMVHTLIGTALVSLGSGALNHYHERDVDARMPRTKSRPIPAGLVSPGEALVFGYALAIVGLGYLLHFVNPLATLVVAATLVSYVYVYTPLKRRTTISTLVGAIPGALPIMAGWAGAGHGLELAAWVLFAILFLWQIPHFLALAWLYREDYRAGGLVMLSVDDDEGISTGRQIFNYTAGLVAVSVLPSVLGLTGTIYFVGAIALGIAFLGFGFRILREPTPAHARALFLASVTYLPLLLILMVVDKLPR